VANPHVRWHHASSNHSFLNSFADQLHCVLLCTSNNFRIFFSRLWAGKCMLWHAAFALMNSRCSVCGYKFYGILVAIMVNSPLALSSSHFALILYAELCLCRVRLSAAAYSFPGNQQWHFLVCERGFAGLTSCVAASCRCIQKTTCCGIKIKSIQLM
jgi:hypothetical protein